MKNRATLLMAGDALIHSAIYEDAVQPDGSYDFKPMIAYIKPISSRFDLAYYNQETILGGEALGLSSYPRFNSPVEVGDAFIDAGFNLVSLASNHTMDMDEEGVIRSVAYWKSKQDKVVFSGQWTSAKAREEEIRTIYEINGIRYAFISYTMWTNELETPPGKEYLNNVYSDEKAAADISKVRDKADLIIVSMHWGTEYNLKVDHVQKNTARYLSELGVHIIIGAHPHVVQTLEYINEGKTFVIYSLGNLLSDQWGLDKRTGLMVGLDIHKVKDENGKTKILIENPRGELVFNASSRTGKRNFTCYPDSCMNDTILPGFAALEDYRAIVSSGCPEFKWGLAPDDPRN